MTPTLPATAANLIDTRYGFTEQVVPPSASSLPTLSSSQPTINQAAPTQGIYYVPTGSSVAGGGNIPPPNAATMPIYHTLGWANEYEQGSINPAGARTVAIEGWDHLPIHDRDFTSVAELTLVPACPPGLFTKQFGEFAPSQMNIANYFSAATPQTSPGITQGLATTMFVSTYSNTVNPSNPSPTIPTLSWYAPAPGLLYANSTTMPLSYSTTVNLATASTPFLSPSSTYPPPPLGATTPPVPIQPHTSPYLTDKFFYTGASNTMGTGGLQPFDTPSTPFVGGQAADGWFKMFEFFEVPSQMIGAIGPVAQGTNFDWARQDFKPGLLNLNLIIDEEVFLSLLGKQTVTQQNGQTTAPVTPPTNPPSMTSQNEFDQFAQQHLNMNQIQPIAAGNYTPSSTSNPLPLPTGTSPIPMVVTATLNNGAPASAYPLASAGLLSYDPITNYLTNLNGGATPTYSNALKASFVQFLWLRHGGSGYMFGWGNGSVGQNLSIVPPSSGAVGSPAPAYTAIPREIPFHSLSYPDIDYTVMRPAALPPNPVANYTNPAQQLNPSIATEIYYAADPGVRSPGIYSTSTLNPAYSSTYYPGIVTSSNNLLVWKPVYPPPIPARRLFQVPDAYNVGNPMSYQTTLSAAVPVPPTTIPSATYPAPSNASEWGDPYVNDTTPNTQPGLVYPPGQVSVPLPATGALPPVSYGSGLNASTGVLTDSVVNLYWPTNGVAVGGTTYGFAGTSYTASGAVPVPLPPNVGSSAYLGGNNGGGNNFDKRQHPYWRSEEMQRVVNLTTVRTHQYAVWITVGFFQVKREGDIGMASIGIPTLAYDIMGPENGALDGTNVRYRGFFLIDRLKLTGYDPGNSGQYHQAVVYSNRIQ